MKKELAVTQESVLQAELYYNRLVVDLTPFMVLCKGTKVNSVFPDLKLLPGQKHR